MCRGGVLAKFEATLRAVLRRGVAHDAEAPSAKLRRAFGTLGLVQDECTEEDVKKAYLKLARQHHPDSRTAEADSDRFIMVG